jgi:hypothetical protein
MGTPLRFLCPTYRDSTGFMAAQVSAPPQPA